MIGQDRLLKELKSFDLYSLPHSMMFIGEDGCGKHVLANEISSYYGLSLYDISENIDFETISGIYEKTLEGIYLIDLSNATEREQNVILKFLEEPLDNSYIIILCESKNSVLETIVNRCVSFTFDVYADDELLSFCKNKDNADRLIKYCRTPGKLLKINEKTIDDTIALSESIMSNIGKARFPNALTIVNKINYKDEYDKISYDLFLDVLLRMSYDRALEDPSYKTMYETIDEEISKLSTYSPNKEMFVEHLIVKLWKVAKSK